jgi:hypothetical protein
MKNLKNRIGNQNRDLPACSAVTQPNAPPRTPSMEFKFELSCSEKKKRDASKYN